GVFLVENLSVVLQVSWFKFTKKKTGIGKSVFLMAPLHHHYQKMGFHESKVVVRFWIIAIMLAIMSIVTLNVRWDDRDVSHTGARRKWSRCRRFGKKKGL